MALNLGLISFEFSQIGDLDHDPKLEHRFDKSTPQEDEALQPIVAEAVAKVKKCLAASISTMFTFVKSRVTNISNFLHVAIMSYNTDIMHNDGSQGQTCIVATVKIYHVNCQEGNTYKVSLDIEEMPSSTMACGEANAFAGTLTNEQIKKLVSLLDDEFQCKAQLEYMPVIKRGRLHLPHFLISSDERLMEYDFDKLLFHRQSEFQDVKIVSSPSLGNTLLLDNLQNLSEVDLPYTYALMDRKNVSYKDKEILILGGGDGGLLWELLKEEPKFVTMAEIDPVVIEACREYMQPCGKVLEFLEGANYMIIIDDCMKVLRKSVEEGKKYDVIFNDLTDIPVCRREESLTAFESSAVQKDSPWHFIEAIFNLSLACLKQDGLYMNHATGKGNVRALRAYEEFLQNSKVEVDFKSRFSYVPSFMEIWVFYTITKRRKD